MPAKFWGTLSVMGWLLRGTVVGWGNLPPASAMDASINPPGASISGTVVDPQGNPVAAARVWLMRASFPQESTLVESTTTDAAGRFTLHDAPRDNEPNKWLGLAARDRKGRLGGAKLPPAGDPAGQSIRIELSEVQDFHGKLTDTADKPIARAPIRLMRLGAYKPGRPADRRGIGIAPEVAAEIVDRTSDDGSFVLHGVPIEGDVMLEVVAPEFGRPWIWLNLNKSMTVRLGRAGSLTGSLHGPADATVCGVRLTLWMTWSRDEPYSSYNVGHEQETRTNKDGRFCFAAVPSGTYRVRIHSDEKSAFAAADSPALKVKPGEEATASLLLCRLITVKGRVIDHQTKAGVPGVRLQFYTDNEKDRESMLRRETQTDTHGEYSLRLLPGKVCGYVNSCPEEYTIPDSGPGLRRDPLTGDATWPVIELERATSIEGSVVDEAGRPVAEAEVYYYVGGSSINNIQNAKCDIAGKFVLKHLPTKGTVALQARTDTAATTDPQTVALGETKGTVRLALSQTRAAGVRGFLLDESGKPVDQAYVSLTCYWSFGRTKLGFDAANTRSNALGQFEIGGLWPGEYELLFSVPDAEVPQRPKAKLRPAESLDLGKIVIDSARKAIGGIVVDSTGKPLEGVQVFHSGDAPRRLATRTDAAGRFHLEGFRTGPAYLFAQRPGYRFRAVLVDSGAMDASIRLLHDDEPLPPRPATKQISEQRQHELARSMLEKFWGSGSHTGMEEAIAAMALLDLPKARQWAAGRGAAIEDSLQVFAALNIADRDFEEMLGLLPHDAPRVAGVLGHIAERCEAHDPAKALRCAEEGIVRARAASAPDRAEALAQFGGLLVRLGRAETGRKLIDEAAQVAARLPPGPRNDLVRGKVAGAMAALDVQRALALLASISDRNQRHAWMPRVVAASSVNNLEQSRALCKELEPFYASRAQAATACRLAEIHPEEALQIVDRLEGNEAAGQKIEALGWIAEKIARRDKPRACAILDRALAIAMEPLTGNTLTYRRELPAKAAFLAVYAQRMGYPDLQSVSDRVLASRPPLADVGIPEYAFETNLGIAVVLATVDPATASQLLQVIEPQVACLEASDNRRLKSKWFIAWALADPEHAVELANRQWAAGSKNPDWDIAASGVLDVPMILSLPASERLEIGVGQMASLGIGDVSLER